MITQFVTAAAEAHARTLLAQASKSEETQEKTHREHYLPLKQALAHVVGNQLTVAEMHALLWAVRHIDFESLHSGPYAPPHEGAAGYGNLSAAANKVERVCGRAEALLSAARSWLRDHGLPAGPDVADWEQESDATVYAAVDYYYEGGVRAFLLATPVDTETPLTVRVAGGDTIEVTHDEVQQLREWLLAQPSGSNGYGAAEVAKMSANEVVVEIRGWGANIDAVLGRERSA